MSAYEVEFCNDCCCRLDMVTKAFAIWPADSTPMGSPTENRSSPRHNMAVSPAGNSTISIFVCPDCDSLRHDALVDTMMLPPLKQPVCQAPKQPSHAYPKPADKAGDRVNPPGATPTASVPAPPADTPAPVTTPRIHITSPRAERRRGRAGCKAGGRDGGRDGSLGTTHRSTGSPIGDCTGDGRSRTTGFDSASGRDGRDGRDGRGPSAEPTRSSPGSNGTSTTGSKESVGRSGSAGRSSPGSSPGSAGRARSTSGSGTRRAGGAAGAGSSLRPKGLPTALSPRERDKIQLKREVATLRAWDSEHGTGTDRSGHPGPDPSGGKRGVTRGADSPFNDGGTRKGSSRDSREGSKGFAKGPPKSPPKGAGRSKGPGKGPGKPKYQASQSQSQSQGGTVIGNGSNNGSSASGVGSGGRRKLLLRPGGERRSRPTRTLAAVPAAALAGSPPCVDRDSREERLLLRVSARRASKELESNAVALAHNRDPTPNPNTDDVMLAGLVRPMSLELMGKHHPHHPGPGDRMVSAATTRSPSPPGPHSAASCRNLTPTGSGSAPHGRSILLHDTGADRYPASDPPRGPHRAVHIPNATPSEPRSLLKARSDRQTQEALVSAARFSYASPAAIFVDPDAEARAPVEFVARLRRIRQLEQQSKDDEAENGWAVSHENIREQIWANETTNKRYDANC